MPRWSILLLFPFLPGCLAYAYPSVTSTPQVTGLPGDVHAFKESWGMGGMSMIMTGGESFSRALEELPIQHGCLEPQHDAYCAYFVGGFPVGCFESRNWRVLLYRPGYEPVELDSRWWGQALVAPESQTVTWKCVEGVSSNVKVLDELYLKCLWPGTSERVRQFVAQEFERLANAKVTMSADLHQDLLAKARRMRGTD
jgi:hypothetical protein